MLKGNIYRFHEKIDFKTSVMFVFISQVIKFLINHASYILVSVSWYSLTHSLRGTTALTGASRR
jgi:hypothetical protein